MVLVLFGEMYQFSACGNVVGSVGLLVKPVWVFFFFNRLSTLAAANFVHKHTHTPTNINQADLVV